MPSLKDLLGGAARNDLPEAVSDPELAKRFPLLNIMLTRLTDDTDKRRRPCTLTIVCEDGVVKAGLNERDHALSLWTTCQSLGGVFAALEEALGEVPPRWRRSGYEKKK